MPAKPPKIVHCPICKKALVETAKAFPFCSERCRLVDLGNWLDEKYVIAPDPQSDPNTQ
jgi:endogenous inhibitor of DNA gyrase (YacG/DUF329 family)